MMAVGRAMPKIAGYLNTVGGGETKASSIVSIPRCRWTPELLEARCMDDLSHANPDSDRRNSATPLTPTATVEPLVAVS